MLIPIRKPNHRTTQRKFVCFVVVAVVFVIEARWARTFYQWEDLQQEGMETKMSEPPSGKGKYVRPFYARRPVDYSPYRYQNDKDIAENKFLLLNLVKESNPHFCRVSFGPITAIWSASTTYTDLLEVCASHGTQLALNSLLPSSSSDIVSTDNNRTRTILFHQVPKTASTSVRHAVLHRNRNTCGNDAKFTNFGCDTLPALLASPCGRQHLQSVIHSTMTIPANYPRPCFDYHDKLPDRVFCHAIPFRMFRDWARSAQMQDISRAFRKNQTTVARCKEQHDRFRNHCQAGLREFDARRYSKWILRSVLKESTYPIFLYDYRNTSYVLTQLVVEQFGQEPYDMSRKFKQELNDKSCERDVLKAFYDCSDESLWKGWVD